MVSRFRVCFACSCLFIVTVSSAGVQDAASSATQTQPIWIEVTDFEETNPLENWLLRDTHNNTDPPVANPQVTEVRLEEGNHFLLKKPAAEGVIGNRKALSYLALPSPIAVGQMATVYTRINVEYFPNNHVFGLSNLLPKEIDQHGYDAFEAMLRVTDKVESNGFKNNGTLMTRKGDEYKKIRNPKSGLDAEPLNPGIWYELWYVVDNAERIKGGQKYDVYIRGGDEFKTQVLVAQGADFRMQRERPLRYFLANCNTGPRHNPYGNGGLRYDDIYIAKGLNLTKPR